MKPLIYTFPSYQKQGTEIAKSLGIDSFDIVIHHFPDKESRITLPEKQSDHIIVCLSLDYPNNKLIELLFTCETLRQQGVKRLSLIAPYLCYMRQDKSFNQGEVVSQQIVGEWLSKYFDDVITVDPHLHRITSLNEIITNTNNSALSATTLLGSFIKSLNKDVHLMGPDEESLQWVKQVATICQSTYSTASKNRLSDTHVEIKLPNKNFSKQYIILIDDVISTGNTVAETAKQLYKRGAQQVDVIATHALFTKDAIDTLKNSSIQNIWTSDSITHETNKVSLTALLSDKIKTLF